MEKSVILEAYSRGLLSKDECTKILGIDPNILIDHQKENLYHLKAVQEN